MLPSFWESTGRAIFGRHCISSQVQFFDTFFTVDNFSMTIVHLTGETAFNQIVDDCGPKNLEFLRKLRGEILQALSAA